MKFYNKYFKNSFEELLTYYPSFYHEVYEMREILKAFGNISDDLENAVEQAYFNNFILTADAETVKIWENILHITYSEKLSLDQRKRVIIGRISGGQHIGEPEIRNVIANYTSNPVIMDFMNGIIKIMIEGEIFDEDNLLNTLLQKIPAHLRMKMSIHINRKFRQKLCVNFGGILGVRLKIPIISEDRTSEMQLDFRHGGYVKADEKGIPPGINKSAALRQNGAGGMYCRTHTTSKLIG